MSIKLNSTNGSITVAPEDGVGGVNITLPRAGFLPNTGGTLTGDITSPNIFTNKLTAVTGVLFGTDTSPSSTLNDYEEGTWTPTWASSPAVVNGTGGVTYSGTYTKVGRLVHITVLISVTGTATTASTVSSTRIDNLPFGGAITSQGGGVVMLVNNIKSTGNCVISSSGGNTLWTPTWAATNQDITLSAMYYL